MSQKKIIFNADAVARHLMGLRDGALDESSKWWANVLRFDWTSLRKGNNGTQWANVTYTDETGVSGRLIMRIKGERQNGMIMPNTDAGVAEMAARVKSPNVKVEKRTKKASIQIQKWSAWIETAEDGLTPLVDESGNPKLPDDSTLSDYFKAASCVNDAFLTEAKSRVDNGLTLVIKMAEMKRANKAVTAMAVMAAFDASIEGGRIPGDMILSSESVNTIRRAFPKPSDIEVLTKGAPITSNVKIAELVQTFISDQAKKNAGMPLPNPMTRIAMNFDTTTGIAQMSFFDKDRPYMEDGRQKFDVGKVDGLPINVDNVHKFVVSRSILDGIVNLDSICFSSMGLSMPVRAEVVVVQHPMDRSVTLDDVYGDDDPATTAPAATTVPPATTAPPAAITSESAPADEYNELLSELSGS